MRAPIIVLSGPPGAGKTTVAPILADRFDASVHLLMDDFFHFVRRGYVAPFLSESMPQNTVVVGAVAAAASRYAVGGYTVVLDGIVGPWFIDVFVAEARSLELELHYVVLRPSAEAALRRATTRGTAELADPAPIAGLYAAMANLGSYEGHVVDSTDLDPTATVDTVVVGLEAHRFRLVPTGGREGHDAR